MDLQISSTEMDLHLSITEMVCADFSAGRPKACLWQVFQSTSCSVDPDQGIELEESVSNKKKGGS